MKHTLGVEGKGQQMSFRMTHDSFNPRRNSTVCVSLPCGSTACYKTKLTSPLENVCSKPVSIFRVDKTNDISAIRNGIILRKVFINLFYYSIPTFVMSERK